jgi:hypothetical protein
VKAWALATVIRFTLWLLFLLGVLAGAIVALVFVFTGKCDYSRMQLGGMDRTSAGVLGLPARGYLTISAECASGEGWRAWLRRVLNKIEDNHCGGALLRELARLRELVAGFKA